MAQFKITVMTKETQVNGVLTADHPKDLLESAMEANGLHWDDVIAIKITNIAVMEELNQHNF